MKQKVFYTEICYVLGLIIMAFAAAFTAKADLGMSMVVAPAYILHLKISGFLPWFTFGVAEYVFQGLLIVLTVILMRKFKLSYALSLITAVIYGTLLDGAILLLSGLPSDVLWLRIVWYILGTVLCSFAVSLFFHTYLPPEVYELIVKELAGKGKWEISKVKTVYDCCSTVLGIVLSFCFFGFGVFEGVKIGTVICALVNGFLIGCFTKLLDKHFTFRNKWNVKWLS